MSFAPLWTIDSATFVKTTTLIEPAIAILSAEASAPTHPAHDWFVDRYRRKIADMTEAFTYDQSLGRVHPDRDPRVLARLLIGTWDGMQLQWLIDPSYDMIEAMAAFFAWEIPESVSDLEAVTTAK